MLLSFFFFGGVKSVHSEQQSLLTVKTTVYSNKLHFVSAVKEVGYLLPLFFFFLKKLHNLLLRNKMNTEQNNRDFHCTERLNTQLYSLLLWSKPFTSIRTSILSKTVQMLWLICPVDGSTFTQTAWFKCTLYSCAQVKMETRWHQCLRATA